MMALAWLVKNWKAAALIAAAFAVFIALIALANHLKEAGRSEERAKGVDRYLEDVGKASDAVRARDDVLSGRVRPGDNDKNRRD